MSDPTQPIRDYLACWVPRVDEALQRLLPAADTEPATIHRAMRHSVLGGGKRIRPVLVLLGARAAGGDEAAVLGVSAAVEFVHTYSLIHDDLPCMDDDDFRRGRPSCHKAFGEAIAVLAGDALNTHAFQVLVDEAPMPEHAGRLVRLLCEATGTDGMVGGQVVDLESEGTEPRVDLVEWIHRRKTGALLTCCLQIGATAVGADDTTLTRLGEFGSRMGLAFQIVDDVLDEEGEADDLGKTPGKDREAGKLTYPAAIGVDASRTLAARLLDEADDLVEGLPGEELLRGLGALVLSRRR